MSALRLLLAVLFLTCVQGIAAAWLTPALAAAIVPALLLSIADLVAYPALVGLSLLAGLVTEVGSGLPPGVAFAATAVLPHVFRLAFQHLRIHRTVPLKIAACALAVGVLQAGYLATVGGGDVPLRALPIIVAVRVTLPAAFATALAAVVLRLLGHKRSERVLAQFGTTHG